VAYVQAEDVTSDIFNDKSKNMQYEKYVKSINQKHFISLILCSRSQ